MSVDGNGGGAKGGTDNVHSFVTYLLWTTSLREGLQNQSGRIGLSEVNDKMMKIK